MNRCMRWCESNGATNHSAGLIVMSWLSVFGFKSNKHTLITLADEETETKN